MESIRGRLTLWYATALILSLAVFAIVLYLARRSASYQDLDRRIQSEADLTAGILAESYRARGVSKIQNGIRVSNWQSVCCYPTAQSLPEALAWRGPLAPTSR